MSAGIWRCFRKLKDSLRIRHQASMRVISQLWRNHHQMPISLWMILWPPSQGSGPDEFALPRLTLRSMDTRRAVMAVETTLKGCQPVTTARSADKESKNVCAKLPKDGKELSEARNASSTLR